MTQFVVVGVKVNWDGGGGACKCDFACTKKVGSTYPLIAASEVGDKVIK